jgi:hypothetical protein
MFYNIVERHGNNSVKKVLSARKKKNRQNLSFDTQRRRWRSSHSRSPVNIRGSAATPSNLLDRRHVATPSNFQTDRALPHCPILKQTARCHKVQFMEQTERCHTVQFLDKQNSGYQLQCFGLLPGEPQNRKVPPLVHINRSRNHETNCCLCNTRSKTTVAK